MATFLIRVLAAAALVLGWWPSCRRTKATWCSFPSSFHQSTNSVFLIIFAPVFAWLWIRLGRTGTEPSSPAKFSLGLLFVGAGFAVVAIAARVSAVYLLHTIGELCLSPVGLSTMTKLAPARLAGSIMGVWFMATSIGNFVGGEVAGLFEKFPLPSLFGAVLLVGLITAGGTRVSLCRVTEA